MFSKGGEHHALEQGLASIKERKRIGEAPQHEQKSHAADAVRDENYIRLAAAIVVGLASVLLVGFGIIGWWGLLFLLWFPVAVAQLLLKRNKLKALRELHYEKHMMESGRPEFWGRKSTK